MNIYGIWNTFSLIKSYGDWKKTRWYGIKNDCCNNTNIITNDDTEYSQCVVCFRIFTKGV